MGYGGGGYGGGGGYRGGNGGGFGGGGGGQRQPFQKKEGQGKLFEENKRNPNSPDFSGYIIHNGEEIKFSGWHNQRGPGINLKVKTAQLQPPQGQGGFGQPQGQRYYQNGDPQQGSFQPPPAGHGYGQPPPPVYGGPQPGFGQPPQSYGRPPQQGVDFSTKGAAAVPRPPVQPQGWSAPQGQQPPMGQAPTGGGPEYGAVPPPADSDLPF